MSFRTNPDRILANIDRTRERAAEAREEFQRQASGRELDTEIPDRDAMPAERQRRIFKLVERAYMAVASSRDLMQLAQRFQAIGDIPTHHARGDVTVSIHYMDTDRHDEVANSPFEIKAERFVEEKKTTKTSRADVNGLRILRAELREGVMAAYAKIEPRVREAVRERSDLGHITAQVTMDLRPGS